MYAGTLTEPIDVFRYTLVSNEFGESEEVESKVYHTRANVIHDGGSRRVANEEIQYPYNKTFIVRVYVPIIEDDRIFWNDKYWKVLSIDTDKVTQRKFIKTEIYNE